LASVIVIFVAGLHMFFGRLVPGGEDLILGVGILLLLLSAVSLVALVSPTVRHSLSAEHRYPLLSLSILIIISFIWWAGSFLFLPIEK
jgi:hypothetical protein